jgi:sialic acid synthase SpsE
MRLQLDIGSCHGNDPKKIQEIVDLCAEVGAELKFQLFKNKPPNIELAPEIWDIAVEMCAKKKVPIFASVWDIYGIDILIDSGCQTAKFAYSQNDKSLMIQYALDKEMEVIVSTDIMGPRYLGCVHLYCIPQYPVPYEISFDGLFPRLDGFSDHTLGIRQSLNAVIEGATIIEKHVTTEANDVDCPDAKFAIKPSQVRNWRKLLDDITSGQ